MIANKSNFQFDDFFIVKSSLDFIQPKNNEEITIPEITSQYEIDLNYSFKRDSESIYLFLKVAVNQVTQPKLGYVLFCEGVGVLDAQRISTLSDAEAGSWRINAIGYGISQLRAHLNAITAFCAFGKYTLPLIDLMDLIKSRQKLRTQKTHKKMPAESRPIKTKTKTRKNK